MLASPGRYLPYCFLGLGMASFKERERIQELAASLALQLNVLFPEGYSKGNDKQRAQVHSCCERLLVATAASHHTAGDLKEAMSLAVEEWKKLQQQQKTTCSSGTTKSFSFLDQFGGGFVMINVQEIMETTSLSARLEKLEKIQYLDDILPDWTDVQMMLLEGIRVGVPTLRHANDCLVARDYLRLHRKWFHEGRGSAEYLDIQYQLCRNLSRCLQEMIQQQEQQSTPIEHGDDDASHQHQQVQFFFDVLTLWHDMFLDLMQRDCYMRGEAMSEMESTFVKVLSSSATFSSSTPHVQRGLVPPCQILALVDRRALGWASWIHHLSPHQVVDLCQRQSLLSKVWERVFAMGMSLSEDTQRQEERQYGEPEPFDDQVSRWYSLSILTHMLTRLRVSLFPWHLIKNGNTGTPETARLQFLTRLLQELEPPSSVSEQISTREAWKRELCYAGIETLLSGIHHKELDHAKDIIAKLCCSPKDAKESIRRLESIVDRVDTFSWSS